MRVNQGGADLNVVRSKDSHQMLPDLGPNSNLSQPLIVDTDGHVADLQEPIFGQPGMMNPARLNATTSTNHKSGGNLGQGNIHDFVAQQTEKPYTAAEGVKRRARGIVSEAKTGFSSKQSTAYTGGQISGAKQFPQQYAGRGNSIPGMTRSAPKHIQPLRNAGRLHKRILPPSGDRAAKLTALSNQQVRTSSHKSQSYMSGPRSQLGDRQRLKPLNMATKPQTPANLGSQLPSMDVK